MVEAKLASSSNPKAARRLSPARLAAIALLLAALAAVYASGAHRFLTLDGLKANYADLLALYAQRPALVIGCFMAAQVLALTCLTPGAVLPFSLAAGALFGTAPGMLIVLLAVTAGDSLGFLIARLLLRDWVQARFADQLAMVDRGVEKDGAFYLLALRLTAVVPFFVVNLTMALTRLPLKVFAPVSLIGLMPATFLYVSAGTALAELDSAADILSPPLIALLAAIGILPVLARAGFRVWRRSDRA